jgi:chemotaxis protein CheD
LPQAPTVITATKPPFVGMAQIVLLEGDQSAIAVLGSCVGLALYSSRDGWGALAHIVLPTRENREGPPGKFVDSAIPEMIAMLAKKGVSPARLSAKVAGGASMFNSSGPIQVGQANAEAVRRSLQAHRIGLVAADFGGNKGRRIVFECAAGQMHIEIAGAAVQTL